MDESKRRIVAVVDDDYRVLESLESLLASSGLTVVLFTSPEDFIREFESLNVDCLISDIDMPGLSGVELRRHVRQRQPRMPVIFITGRYRVEDFAAELKDDHHLFFKKPFDVSQLLATVRGVLNQAGCDAAPGAQDVSS
ncbi:response regulator transcription factor [Paraburkholderia sp. DHOC27]|uniref:response regulator transcription factor n=1 Tax=Paraburkholderia sp. DHOC27 TaxID=2303330 RepID=UPI000E3E2D7C|nr:response regulator [Paraburkholderia sp. DHOC27]RFU49063.1 response regulator [Paraburkholderia sp. DHOC27]